MIFVQKDTSAKYVYFTPMKQGEAPLLILLIVSVFLTVILKKLTLSAAITGCVLCWLIFEGAGWTGVCLLAAFFVLGTGSTMWQLKAKEKRDIAERDSGRRKMSQVLANAGVAAMAAILCVLFPLQAALFRLLMAAALSSATADTLSSELGNLYGKRFYNIITLKNDTRGLDGVVSLEGTAAGIAGSSIIACIAVAGFGWNAICFMIVVVAGTLGNLSDSLLGAAFERRNFLHNDAVNFLNTLVAALAAFVLHLFWV